MAASREAEFHRAILDLDARTRKETGYKGHSLRQMIGLHGGYQAARHLLRNRGPALHEGLVSLYLEGRVDLSVEALVVSEQWRHLFPAEQGEAQRRLALCGYRQQKAA
jgi:hypothetical protein